MRSSRPFRLLAMLFALSLLAAACGDDAEETDTAAGGEEGEGTETTAAPEGEGEGSEEGGCEGEGLRVGVVYDLGGRGDQSFNDSAAAGLDQACEELDIELRELEPDEGGENREELLRLLAEDGFELVLGVGFLFTDAITAAAPDFPDTTFAIVDAEIESPNVASLTFAEEQGSFLVGAAAALKSEGGTVGFIGGVETDLIKKFEGGFIAGVAQIDPEIEVLSAYLTQPPDFGGFNDPARGREAALSQFGEGADIIYHAAGGSGRGLFEAAAEEEGRLAIGVDSDQYNQVDDELKDVILTSMLKRVDVAVFDTIQRLSDEEDVAGTTVFDLEADGVGFSTAGGQVDDIEDQLNELRQMIIDGDIEVPTAP